MAEQDRERITLNIPVKPRLYASLTVTKPMTVAEWDQMMRVLEAMKPGLLDQDDPDDPDDPAVNPADGGWPR